MNKRISFIVLLSFIVSLSAFSQSAPIPLETLVGDQKLVLSFGVSKPIGENFKYVNSTSATSYYDYKKGATELVTVNNIFYKLHNNIDFGAGLQYHFAKGFIPNVALNFAYSNPTWLLALSPYYNFMPWSNIEIASVAEFKPSIGNNLRLFTRVQGFYGHDFVKNERERAKLYLRLGLKQGKFIYGAGVNYDYYRSHVQMIDNYGGFIRIDI